ncbi:MAG: N-acetylmuramoyl-L-alanine amidase [Candidatus Eiseniibacteriota bacterium]|nr:MAG: N-acetylmuramoyl-L-alanine amidase [Candidatus Eisenbacteria bacterium]
MSTGSPMSRVPWTVALVSLFVLLSVSPAECALTVTSIRHWTAPDHTRIVVDLSSAPTYRHRELSDPARIAIDVAEARFDPSVQMFAVSDGLVERVRVNSLSGPVAQVVLDLTKKSEFRVFYLKKYAGKPHRIVIDVKRPRAPDAAVQAQERVRKLKQKDVRIVVIDPGHGGEDPGAVGPRSLKEKDVCLNIAKKLKEKIDGMDGMKAFLTRTGDYFVPLRKRTQIAKELGADIFVSLHANASRSKRAFGTEVYFLSMTGASDEAAREVARLENAADLVGGVPPETEDDIVSILMDLKHSNALARSSELAEKTIDSLGRHGKLVTRGVKQARFTVLKSADFPSILIEFAFISNPVEAALLRSERFHDEVAGLLSHSLEDYCTTYASLGPPATSALE